MVCPVPVHQALLLLVSALNFSAISLLWCIANKSRNGTTRHGGTGDGGPDGGVFEETFPRRARGQSALGYEHFQVRNAARGTVVVCDAVTVDALGAVAVTLAVAVDVVASVNIAFVLLFASNQCRSFAKNFGGRLVATRNPPTLQAARQNKCCIHVKHGLQSLSVRAWILRKGPSSC